MSRLAQLGQKDWFALMDVGIKTSSPPEVDRIWGMWGSYYNIPKPLFYLLKEDYSLSRSALYSNCVSKPKSRWMQVALHLLSSLSDCRLRPDVVSAALRGYVMEKWKPL